jgi:hypothetical protein
MFSRFFLCRSHYCVEHCVISGEVVLVLELSVFCGVSGTTGSQPARLKIFNREKRHQHITSRDVDAISGGIEPHERRIIRQNLESRGSDSFVRPWYSARSSSTIARRSETGRVNQYIQGESASPFRRRVTVFSMELTIEVLTDD